MTIASDIRARAADLADDPRVAAVVGQLRAGNVACFPTETVFALACAADRADAIEQLFAVKQRSRAKPIAVLVANAVMAADVVEVSQRARAVMERLWPGPLTIVLPAKDSVPASLRAGGANLGVRCPAHPLALAIIEALGSPVAATSVNLSGEPPATTADQARAAVAHSGALVVDDEPPVARGGASTVVILGDDAQADVIVRDGPISLEQVRAAASSC